MVTCFLHFVQTHLPRQVPNSFIANDFAGFSIKRKGLDERYNIFYSRIDFIFQVDKNNSNDSTTLGLYSDYSWLDFRLTPISLKIPQKILKHLLNPVRSF